MSIISQASVPAVRPPRIVIHGKPGVGKTTFAADLPSPIFLPVEEGVVNMNVMAVPRPRTFAEVMQILRELYEEDHDYKTVVIDSIDHVEPLIWQYTCETESGRGKADYPSIESFGYGKGYLHAEAHHIDFFKALDLLRANGMIVCVLSHSQVVPVTDPIIGAYDTVSPKLHKRANDLLYGWCDVLGYLDVERIALQKEGARKRKFETSKVLQGNRIIYVEDVGGYAAKNRYDLDPKYQVDKDHPSASLMNAIRAAVDNNKAAAAATEEG